MKPLSILVTIILGVATLGAVVWIGKYNAGGLLPEETKIGGKDAITDDLPLPRSGPFGKVELDEEYFDFGFKRVGMVISHDFRIKNAGDGPLLIKLGDPSCSCTVGQVTSESGELIKEGPFKSGDRVTIAPKEAVNIQLKWSMKSAIEKFRQYVPVATTDPDRRKFDLVVMGHVDDPIQIVPGDVWDLGEISTTEPTKVDGIVYSAVLDEFTITQVPKENSRLKVTWVPANYEEAMKPAAKELLEVNPELPTTDSKQEYRAGYKVMIEAGPNVPVGMFRETVKLKIETKYQPDQAKPELVKDFEGDFNVIYREFAVTGRRKGPIEVRGAEGARLNILSNRVIFGDFPAAEGRKAKVTMFVIGLDQELELKSVDPAGSPIKAQLVGAGKALGKTKMYTVEVEIPPGPVGQHVQDHAIPVTLKLNHPDAPDFVLLIDYNAK